MDRRQSVGRGRGDERIVPRLRRRRGVARSWAGRGRASLAATQSRFGRRVTHTTRPFLTGDLDALDAVPRVVTIGTFDGVHLGHRRLLERAVARGRELGLLVLVVTFEPIPAMVLRPDRFPGRICSVEEKLARLAAAGVGEIATLALKRSLAGQSPDEFMAGWEEHTSELQ